MAKQDQDRPLVQTQAPPSVYANSAEINITTWDFRFKFGEIEKVSPEEIAVAERVRVVMSPQHAKVFSRVLADHITKYEKAFGEINTVPVEDKSTKTPPTKAV